MQETRGTGFRVTRTSAVGPSSCGEMEKVHGRIESSGCRGQGLLDLAVQQFDEMEESQIRVRRPAVHVADEALTVTAVAACHGVTPLYVHKLCEKPPIWRHAVRDPAPRQGAA